VLVVSGLVTKFWAKTGVVVDLLKETVTIAVFPAVSVSNAVKVKTPSGRELRFSPDTDQVEEQLVVVVTGEPEVPEIDSEILAELPPTFPHVPLVEKDETLAKFT
jgi:hypothetical protein